MRKKGNKESFWPSYVDVVTTLFAIMVVLFAVSYSRFRVKEVELRKLADKYEEIKSIYDMVEKIDTNYFEFNKEYVKHIFKIQVTFQKGKFDIEHELQSDLTNETAANALRDQIYAAGQEIKSTIEKLQRSESNKQDIKYLVVIEGQSSADIIMMLISTMTCLVIKELLNCINTGKRKVSISPQCLSVNWLSVGVARKGSQEMSITRQTISVS